MIATPLEQFNILSVYEFVLGIFISVFKCAIVVGATLQVCFGWVLVLIPIGWLSHSFIVGPLASALLEFVVMLVVPVFVWPIIFGQKIFVWFWDLLGGYLVDLFWVSEEAIWPFYGTGSLGWFAWNSGYSSGIYSWALLTHESLLWVTFLPEFAITAAHKLGCCNLNSLIVSINNSSVWLVLAISVFIGVFRLILLRQQLVCSNNWQQLIQYYYELVLGLIVDNIGAIGIPFLPLLFTTFSVIFICNMLGMLPYSFTVTSHLIVTFVSALSIFVGLNILGVLQHKTHFLSLFFPPGAPVVIAPLLVLIETVSYIFRVLSLAIRLFANLMSGHTLLKIIATVAWATVNMVGVHILPISLLVIITGLELAIGFLQAYIFCVLLCIYLNDAFNLH